MNKEIEVPIWEKVNLTVKEASALFGIGEKRVKDLVFIAPEEYNVYLYVGVKLLIRRKQFQDYLLTLKETSL